MVKNLSLSNTIKIELIAQLLRSRSHEVDIISLGEVVETGFKFYRAFFEKNPFHPEIPIYYASALPVRYLNGFWSNSSMLRFFKERHRLSPYDIVIVFNLKHPHIACASYATRALGLPVVLEYEDDSFVDVKGQAGRGIVTKLHHKACSRVINGVSGGIGVSPYLLSQLPTYVPKLLLRGVLGDDIVNASERTKSAKKNWVLFSGTHIESNGVGELIEAWDIAQIPDWELHITGHGQLTEKLKQLAAKNSSIRFHGLVTREVLVGLLSSAKICINPHAVSKIPGNVFAFKIIEYLGAGAHVISTPMGTLEKDVEAGITYIPDNNPKTIAAALRQVVLTDGWANTAVKAVRAVYGASAVAESLDKLLQRIVNREVDEGSRIRRLLCDSGVGE